MSSRQNEGRQKQINRYKGNQQTQKKFVTQQDILRKHHRFLRQSSSSNSSKKSDSPLQRSARKPYSSKLPPKTQHQPSKKQQKPEKTSKPSQISQTYTKYGQTLARKYYQKLFKQYALVDLSRYQTGQIGCRWRTETQVLAEKGQKICAEVGCRELANNIYQMNFGYMQGGEKKNALVKICVCGGCEGKLNYKKKYRKVQQDNIKSVDKAN